MLTSFPSATAFALALGAGSPCADEPCAGTLGLPATGTLTLLIATHVSMCTSDTSSRPHDRPSPAYGTLRYRARGQMSDVRCQKAQAADPTFGASPAASARSRDTPRASAATWLHRCSRGRDNSGHHTRISSAEPIAIIDEALELGRGARPAGRTLRPGWRRSTCSRAGSAPPAPAARSAGKSRLATVDIQGQSIRPLERPRGLHRILPPSRRPTSAPVIRHSVVCPLIICHLSSDPRSFGAWLEPRYIFGAGQLFDQ